MDKGAHHIIPTLVQEIGLGHVSYDPMQWPHALHLEFGGTSDVNGLVAQARRSIREQLPTGKTPVMGIYAIYDAQGLCIYIGKSKNFDSRFMLHYRATIGLEKFEKYRNFFGHLTGPMTFRWIQVQYPLEHSKDKQDSTVRLHYYKGETLRIALERLISCHMLANSHPPQPVFEHLHASIK